MAVLEEIRPPVEGIRHQQPDTELYIGSNNVGKGTLFVAESVVSWLSQDGKGITLPYLNIILHAVSRDLQKFPQECLYVHTDAQVGDDEESEEDDDDGIIDYPPSFKELYFVPDDKESLSVLFQAMAQCQALHPDPQEELSPDEDFFDGEDYELENAPARFANLQLSSNGHDKNGHDVDMDPECFEDAEEDAPDQ